MINIKIIKIQLKYVEFKTIKIDTFNLEATGGLLVVSNKISVYRRNILCNLCNDFDC